LMRPCSWAPALDSASGKINAIFNMGIRSGDR
jgi:hypothetical protein